MRQRCWWCFLDFVVFLLVIGMRWRRWNHQWIRINVSTALITYCYATLALLALALLLRLCHLLRYCHYCFRWWRCRNLPQKIPIIFKTFNENSMHFIISSVLLEMRFVLRKKKFTTNETRFRNYLQCSLKQTKCFWFSRRFSLRQQMFCVNSNAFGTEIRTIEQKMLRSISN